MSLTLPSHNFGDMLRTGHRHALRRVLALLAPGLGLVAPRTVPGLALVPQSEQGEFHGQLQGPLVLENVAAELLHFVKNTRWHGVYVVCARESMV